MGRKKRAKEKQEGCGFRYVASAETCAETRCWDPGWLRSWECDDGPWYYTVQDACGCCTFVEGPFKQKTLAEKAQKNFLSTYRRRPLREHVKFSELRRVREAEAIAA